MSRTRQRAIPFRGAVPSRTVIWDTVGANPTSVTRVSTPPHPLGPHGTQVTVSENHPGWRRRKRGAASGDIGGDFYTSKKSARLIGGQVSMAGEGIIGGFLKRAVQYDGYFIPFEISPGWPPDASSAQNALDVYGMKAISQCKPTNALVDLSTTLGELAKDGAPNKIGAELWKAGIGRARKAIGHEYLNVEFGWKPLVNDIRDTVNAMRRADAAVEQYRRDAGKVVRRRFKFPTVSDVSTVVSHQNLNAFAGFDDEVLRNLTETNQGRVLRTRETRIERWFSGAFTYHLPLSVGGVAVPVRAKKVFGLDPSPETLWNLAPWSWAVDWFVPVGDLIGNLQDWASDGQVLVYGYIMEHSFVRDTYVFDGPTGFYSDARPGKIVYLNETKQRRRATPFGFGLSWAGFTPRQLAIAAALGLSRSK